MKRYRDSGLADLDLDVLRPFGLQLFGVSTAFAKEFCKGAQGKISV